MENFLTPRRKWLLILMPLMVFWPFLLGARIGQPEMLLWLVSVMVYFWAFLAWAGPQRRDGT